MTARLASLLVLTALVVGVPVAFAATKKITPKGVGAVKLGMTYNELRDKGLLGRLQPGCELAGPDQRSANLKKPLKGSVDLTQTSPRRVQTIHVRGGATARGVGVGATRTAVKSAFPKVKFDHSTDAMFGITLAKVPKNGGGRLQFAIDTSTKKVVLIGIPRIAFCE
jgi:hypothetical protein